MALTDNGNGMYMPVAPAYGYGGGNCGFGGFGGDWGWIVLLLLLAGGGWGNGFGGGFGGGYDFPWLMNGQQNINTNTNNGFRDQMINDNVTSVRDAIASLATQLCSCCGDMQMSIANLGANIEQGANTRQMANMQQNFALSQQVAQMGCDNKSAIKDVQYTIATEGCQTRANATQNTQTILDKLCQLELDGYKRENDNLRSQLNMATLRESQTAQNAFISNGFANEVDQLYNRLSSCPIGTVPVAGSTPLFSCNPSFNGNNGCGCGCGFNNNTF